MTKYPCGGGRPGRPLQILSLGALLCLFSPFALSQISDFLIVQHTERLVLYDSFQQSLSSSETPIRPFEPVRIVTQRDVLGDGITPCMKVEAAGEIYFVLRDDKGRLAGWKTLGIVRTFRQRIFIGDTATVMRSNHLALRPSAEGRLLPLKAGDRCIRYFVDGTSCYVGLLGNESRYGWLALPAHERGIWWKIVRPEPLRTELSPMIKDRIIAKVNEVNDTFRQVYESLGNETGKQLLPPQWILDSRADGLSVTLRPTAAVRFYPRSVSEFASTLQAYVAGTGYEVRMTGNRIDIVRP